MVHIDWREIIEAEKTGIALGIYFYRSHYHCLVEYICPLTFSFQDFFVKTVKAEKTVAAHIKTTRK